MEPDFCHIQSAVYHSWICKQLGFSLRKSFFQVSPCLLASVFKYVLLKRGMHMLWSLLCFLFLFHKGTFPLIPQIDLLIIFQSFSVACVHTFRSRIGLAIQEAYWGLGTGVGEGRGEASGVGLIP